MVASIINGIIFRAYPIIEAEFLFYSTHTLSTSSVFWISETYTMDMEPFISDQYRTAQAYFLSVLGLVLVESFFRLPLYLIYVVNQGTLRIVYSCSA